MYQHCADREVHGENYWQVLTCTNSSVPLLQNLCISSQWAQLFLLQLEFRELDKIIILKPYNIQTPKEQVYFYFGKQLQVELLRCKFKV